MAPVAAASAVSAPVWVPIAIVAGGAAYGGYKAYELCHSDDNDKCKEKIAEVFEQMAVVEKRLADLYVDRYNQYNVARYAPSPSLPSGTGNWTGHQQAAANAQTRLKRLIGEAVSLRCKVPPYAWELAKAPIPNRPAVPR